jgi:hypothetical protein
MEFLCIVVKKNRLYKFFEKIDIVSYALKIFPCGSVEKAS